MRQKRAKAYKRLMTLYAQTFNFRQPYQVLVADDFLLELANKQLDVAKQLATCVQGECKPMITQCCVQALYKLGKDYQSVTEIAKTFERRRCNHREAIEPEACIKEVVGPSNKHRYVLALQSSSVRAHLRAIPGVPIVHFNDRGVMVVEMPSKATLDRKDEAEAKLLTAQTVTHPLADNIVTDANAAPDVPKRKAPKAPNPLSMRKKKTEPKPAQAITLGKRDRYAAGAEDEDEAEPAEAQESEGPKGRRKKKRKRATKVGKVLEEMANDEQSEADGSGGGESDES